MTVYQFRDRVMQMSTSTGVGNMTVAGTVTGWRPWASAALSIGALVLYTIIDATAGDWETGKGTYSAANTLQRDTVIESSNANAKVNFAGNSKSVMLDTPSDWFRYPQSEVWGTTSTGLYPQVDNVAKLGDPALRWVRVDAQDYVASNSFQGIAGIFSSYAQSPLQLVRAASYPQTKWEATSNPTDAKNWWLTVQPTGELMYQAINDANDTVLRYFYIGRDGEIRLQTTASALIRFGGFLPLSTTFNCFSLNGYIDQNMVGLVGGGNANLYYYSQAAHFFRVPVATVLTDVANIDVNGMSIATTTAHPAGGLLLLGLQLGNVANFGVTFGSGAPNKAWLAGSLYLHNDAGGVPYVNVDGATTGWKQLALAENIGPLSQNAQTGNYTCVLADANDHIYHAVAAAAATYTIPANASVAYPIGTTLTFVNDSVNNVTIAITTDTMVWSPGTATGSRTLAQGGMATALKVTSTRWVISGTGLT